MSVPDPINLPSKFHPFYIGHDSCPINKNNFQFNPQGPLKDDHIIDAGKWVLKLPRTDLLTTPDTHLYRVRKAEKIRTFIVQNNLGAHIAVPKKYLYWSNEQQKFYVVAEKMNLSNEVATPASQLIENTLKLAAVGQAQALADRAPQRSLTPVQAKALAELSILGYTDLSYNNLYFTDDGKVAIIDTEPQKRALKKRWGFIASLLNDRGALLTAQALSGIAKLKLYTDNPNALREVQIVEAKHALWRIAQSIAKIAIVALAIYFTPAVTALVPIAALATTLQVGFTALAIIKGRSIASGGILMTCNLWFFSYLGLDGVIEIVKLEKQGRF